MGVVKAKIQTVEDVPGWFGLRWPNKQPLQGDLQGAPSAVLHTVGAQSDRPALRVLCYQYGGESESGLQPIGVPGKLALHRVEELRAVELLEGTGRPRRTGRSLPPAWSRPTSMLINRSAIRKRDIEESAPADRQAGDR